MASTTATAVPIPSTEVGEGLRLEMPVAVIGGEFTTGVIDPEFVISGALTTGVTRTGLEAMPDVEIAVDEILGV